jgi:hypothetical protein
VNGKWRYVASAPDLQILFGWLQIGEIIPVGDTPSVLVAKNPWLVDHPHLTESYTSYQGYKNNAIYIGREWLKTVIQSDGNPMRRVACYRPSAAVKNLF